MKDSSYRRVRRSLLLVLVLTRGPSQYKHKNTGCPLVVFPIASALATSSSNLKKTTQARSVVSRLAKAAREAAASKKLEREKRGMDPLGKNKGKESTKELPTIMNLNDVIDEELLHPRDGYKPSRGTGSIRVLLEHNTHNEAFMLQGMDEQLTTTGAVSSSSESGSSPATRIVTKKVRPHQVAIVFARPLVDDQVTIEYASRLMSLAKLIKFEGYRPDLICFFGSQSSVISSHYGQPDDGRRHVGTAVSETAAGVIFFRHLCAANNVSLADTDMCRIPDPIEGSSIMPDGFGGNDDVLDPSLHVESLSTTSMLATTPSKLFHPVVEVLLQNRYLEEWLDESQVYESETDEYGMTRQEPRKKIQIHWTLVSTEYHLCNLNDIHTRSQRQSPLASLVHELEQAVTRHYRRGIVKTTWSFQYSVYPYVYYSEDGGDDVLIAFLGKCYLMAQELVPLLVNLRGVAGNSEFFQRDNYRTLVAKRRSLATLLEEMNEAYRSKQERKTTTMIVPPTLKAQLQKIRSKTTGVDKKATMTMDIHLESALLSLGRCCDLVRPAGTFSAQSVSKQEWRAAIQHLQDFMWRIEQTCDPDRPLPAKQWGKELRKDQQEVDILF